jgi:hypothetical protein
MWQAATEALMLVATHGGPVSRGKPVMFARIFMMKALYPSIERTFDASRKGAYRGKRTLKRDMS